MTGDQMEHEFLAANTSILQDDTIGVCRDMARFVNDFGLYKGDALESWVEAMLRRHTGVDNITLGDVLHLYGRELHITVTNLNKLQTQYLNSIDNPDLVVSQVVRRSAGIPWVFKAKTNESGDVLVDGGVGDNYPIDLFDDSDRYDFKNEYNEKTIGLKMMDSVESRTQLVRTNFPKIKTLVDFTSAIVTFWNLQVERMKSGQDGYWERTITLESPGRDISEFDVSNTAKRRDVETGIGNTITALETFRRTGSFYAGL
jgi:predicted acylesterase/phospholipase RssA